MALIAVYNSKGGVGKTSLAVNLAWCAAKISARRTLLWDLDPQGSASRILAQMPESHDAAMAFVSRKVEARKVVGHTPWYNLDILWSDSSLRDLERYLIETHKKKRLRSLSQDLKSEYQRVIVDCPAGMSSATTQILRAADVVIVPVVPTPLAIQGYEDSLALIGGLRSRYPAVIPVFNMADTRRAVHRTLLTQHSDWPVIPLSLRVEAMAIRQAPLGEFAKGAKVHDCTIALWSLVERAAGAAALG